MKTLVKICGITNLADALTAYEAGADAVGFVFADSPRRISPQDAEIIIPPLPADLITVGLFVNAPLRTIIDAVAMTGIKAIQLHGDESPEFVAKLLEVLPNLQTGCHPWPIVTKAFRPRRTEELAQLGDYAMANAFLIDAYSDAARGGTGQQADWSLATAAGQFGKVILAGGLKPENVTQAIETVRPLGVDVSSGVEATPGKKDAAKVRDFIVKVQQLCVH